jgi:hypothetical protein
MHALQKPNKYTQKEKRCVAQHDATTKENSRVYLHKMSS